MARVPITLLKKPPLTNPYSSTILQHIPTPSSTTPHLSFPTPFPPGLFRKVTVKGVPPPPFPFFPLSEPDDGDASVPCLPLLPQSSWDPSFTTSPPSHPTPLPPVTAPSSPSFHLDRGIIISPFPFFPPPLPLSHFFSLRRGPFLPPTPAVRHPPTVFRKQGRITESFLIPFGHEFLNPLISPASPREKGLFVWESWGHVNNILPLLMLYTRYV